jgi:PAS domain S-box-containing protein
MIRTWIASAQRWVAGTLAILLFCVNSPVSAQDEDGHSIRVQLTAEERAWLADHPTVRFTGDPSWLPIEAFNDQGEYIGIVAEYLGLIESRTGLVFDKVPTTTWSESLQLAQNRQVDVFSAMSNEARREYLTFTSSHMSFPVVITVRREDPDVTSPVQLDGLRVLTLEGYGYVSQLERKYPNIEFGYVSTVKEGVMKVSTGEADALMSSLAIVSYVISDLNLSNLKIAGSTGISVNLGLGVRNDWPELASIINKALGSISQQEKLAIRSRWVPSLTGTLAADDESDQQSAWWLLTGAVTVFLAVLIGALSLPHLFSDEALTRHFGSARFRYIAAASMSLMVAIVGLLVWYTLDQNKKIALDAVSADLRVVLQNTMERNDSWIHGRLNLLSLLGRDPELVAITKRLLQAPREPDSLKESRSLAEARAFVAAREQAFGKIGFFIISPDKISIGSQRDINLGLRNLIAVQEPDLLARVFDGESVFVPPIRSDVSIETADRAAVGRAESPLTMFFAVPIKDLAGDVIAVLTQRLVPSGQMSENMHSGRIGRSGESYMIDSEGRQVTESRFRDQLYEIGLLDQRPASRHAEMRDPGVNLLAGHRSSAPPSGRPFTRMVQDLFRLDREMKASGSVEAHSEIILDVAGYRDYRGVPVYGAWMWELHLGLGIATEIDVAEALGGYHALRLNLLLIAGASLLLALVAALLIITLGERAARLMRRTQEELEDQVAERTERLGAVVDSAPDAMISIDSASRVVAWNPSAELLFGYTEQEMLGQPLARIIPERHHDRHRDGVDAFTQDGEPFDGKSVETEAQHKSGSAVPVELSVAQWQAEGSTFFTGIIRDVSRRKQREHHDQLMAFFREAVWRLDSTSNTHDLVVRLNDVLDDSGIPFRSFGVMVIESEEESRVHARGIGKADKEMIDKALEPARGQLIIEFWRRGEVSYRADLQRDDPLDEQRNWGPSRAPRSIIDIPFSHGTLAINSPEPDAFTPYLELLSKMADILSEGFQRLEDLRALRERTESAEVAQAEADAANASKSAFLANMSHEIRTPMNAILGFSEILAGLEQDIQKRQYLDSVRTSGKSLLGLINDILDLSKVEAGKLELQYKAADAKALCNELEQIFAQKTQEQGIDLIIEADDLPGAIVVDELRLRQILVNLTSNAIKFTESGHVKIKATSEPTQEGTTVRFAVEDSGIGIPVDQQDKVFGAFEQTSGQSAAKFGGTGLGLAISKRLAQMMNGDITLTSELGRGSTFTVELSDLAVVSSDELDSADDDAAEIARVEFEPARVLVVDDVEYNRLLVKTYLAGYELDLIEASGGEEALAMCASDHPDLVLMDLRMERMSGIEATETLKADETLRGITVIAHTASAMKEEEERIGQIFDGYLVKPASKADVVRELMRHLPHQLVEEAPEGARVATASTIGTADSLTPEQQTQLPALVTALEEELGRCEELRQTLTINDVEIFASQIQELSVHHDSALLSDWGERLATQTALFDIPAMSHTLDEYPVLVEQLRSMMASS